MQGELIMLRVDFQKYIFRSLGVVSMETSYLNSESLPCFQGCVLVFRG